MQSHMQQYSRSTTAECRTSVSATTQSALFGTWWWWQYHRPQMCFTPPRSIYQLVCVTRNNLDCIYWHWPIHCRQCGQFDQLALCLVGRLPIAIINQTSVTRSTTCTPYFLLFFACLYVCSSLHFMFHPEVYLVYLV